MFYAAETCAMPVTTLNHLRCYGRAVVHLICNVKENDEASFFSKSLTSKLGMLHLHGLGMLGVAMEGLLKYANFTEETMHPKDNLKGSIERLEWI